MNQSNLLISMQRFLKYDEIQPSILIKTGSNMIYIDAENKLDSTPILVKKKKKT